MDGRQSLKNDDALKYTFIKLKSVLKSFCTHQASLKIAQPWLCEN